MFKGKQTPEPGSEESSEFKDVKDYFGSVLNWTMPGTHIYYRDTTLEADVENFYTVGKVLKAGLFIDLASMLRRPAPGVKTRFMVISAHTADVGDIPGTTVGTHMGVMHPNSFLVVVDVYKVGEVTQICLLHIPFKGIPLFTHFGGINFVEGVTKTSLSDVARKSLDSKMTQPVHELSLMPGWVERTHGLVGLNGQGRPFDLDYLELREDDNNLPEHLYDLSEYIHKLANDNDSLNRP